jgi:hypothetical protein
MAIVVGLVVGVVVLGLALGVKWVWFYYLRRHQARNRDAIAVTDRTAEGLRSIAAADYAQFARRRKGPR